MDQDIRFLPAHAIGRLLRPASVAIIGASDKPGALGASVLSNLDRLRFPGEIFLVNPNRAEIGGRACLKAISDLPEGVDVAILAIPRVSVLEAVNALALRKTGSVVIFSAGFAEGGPEGLAEQQEIAAIAARSGMIVEGPNCLGLVNFVDGIPLTFIETPDIRLDGRPGIGIVSQSGAIAAVVDTTLLARGLGLSFSISTGNEAASGVEDYVEYLIDDPNTHVIGMVVEQFRKPARFLKAARRCIAAGKPIVLLHPGRSSAARESAATHTGAMVGDYQVMKTSIERIGVILVETLEEFGDCLELTARYGRIGGGGTAVVGESGAFKALTLDMAEALNLPLPTMTDEDSPDLRAALPPFVPVSNPVDLTAQSLVDPDLYRRTLAALLADDRVQTIVLGIIQTDAATCTLKFPSILRAIEELKPEKPVIVAGLDEGAPIQTAYVDGLRERDIAYFPSTDRVMRAVSRIDERARRNLDASSSASVTLDGSPGGTAIVPEYKAKDILRSAGFVFPEGALATTPDDACRIATEIGYPVVLKAQSADLSHKSDAGGVIVGLSDDAAVAKGWAELAANIAAHRPGLVLDGVLVETMSPRGIELIIGARNDPEWGPVILAGFGGVQAEVLKDVRLLAPDLTPEAIIDEIRRLKCAALLDGFRGAGPCDVEAVADIVSRLGNILRAEPSIREIDLNPVVVYPGRKGAIILDALMMVGD
ncbi:acetate--CoA ligase family protein [Agrobacterium rosae]|uniref:Acetate--CoA ligase family protein n=1 Tax=Agrobacterium rosae TaxID=1972867 RepID=A0AAW9FM95_9HYPH|nr:acetate--CoA ligase family protein [Agrobacterium rosae]MDX8304604.1 acetate--CoA ligase family protein [Agrobacterium rosae]